MSSKNIILSLLASSVNTVCDYVNLYSDKDQWKSLNNEQKTAVIGVIIGLVFISITTLYSVYEIFKTVFPSAMLIIVLIIAMHWLEKKYNLPFNVNNAQSKLNRIVE